ncbi:shikimate dehydrogenase family protein [Roseibium limicola]|uniref:Shikimate dehydrogenase substrate binding N-terminal domain-containing protein n=1 Tax=Roseibium limicola TaxID=2816037 RepID=A0A939JAZ1_9HYPH|nr:hypothetical protein [Roseibium limicola]MBO0347454.1 hypothetical protein [Roseibium limicola]
MSTHLPRIPAPTGATRLFPIIGHPVSGVFSPPAFNERFARDGIDAVMFGLDIAPEGLDGFWRLMRASANILGCSITYPHKQAAFEAVDAMSDRAARLGALNTVRRTADGKLIGDATDGLAMTKAMQERGIEICAKTVHVAGAGGGAGLAIIDALCELGIAALRLSEIDPVREAAALALVQNHWPKVRLLGSEASADILINATVLGKSEDDALPFTPEEIANASAACDVITASGDTPFLAQARKHGARLVCGNDMGAGQLQAQLDHIGLGGPIADQ